jgi:hypothetical protein
VAMVILLIGLQQLNVMDPVMEVGISDDTDATAKRKQFSTAKFCPEECINLRKKTSSYFHIKIINARIKITTCTTPPSRVFLVIL